ncbi:MAG: class I SAM-dependent methyltransferase [Paracoccaceae bacterium]|nr:class I SAM-dependent methyltransferase [Paracoccaceae bacterium]
MNKSDFWNNVYKSKDIDAVSWYADRLDTSLELIEKNCVQKENTIIDIGSGRSSLAYDLYNLGYNNLTLLDISEEAISQTLNRLGKLPVSIKTIIGNISKITTQENLYGLWHDRAVFHFLTEESQRNKYVQNLKRSLKKNGIAIIATFGPDGPDKCSGLNTMKYDKTTLHAELGDDFQILGSKIDYHQTPFNTSQQFIYCWFKFKIK